MLIRGQLYLLLPASQHVELTDVMLLPKTCYAAATATAAVLQLINQPTNDGAWLPTACR